MVLDAGTSAVTHPDPSHTAPIPPETMAETHDAIVARWKVPPLTATPGGLTWQMLLDALAERIDALLRDNPQKLMSALYILDIPERRFLQAMDQPTQRDRAWDLALAILERESEKIALRKAYRRPPNSDG